MSFGVWDCVIANDGTLAGGSAAGALVYVCLVPQIAHGILLFGVLNEEFVCMKACR